MTSPSWVLPTSAASSAWLPTLISAAFTVTANRQTMLNKIFFIQIYCLV